MLPPPSIRFISAQPAKARTSLPPMCNPPPRRCTSTRRGFTPRPKCTETSLAAQVACGVKVADCVPILVADRRSGAVLAIHSGWQGTAVNVAAASVTALRGVLGASGDLLAAIGPHIEVCCFEVGDDVAERLRSSAPAADAVDRRQGARPHVNLRRIVRAQLSALGLHEEAIEDVGGCTKCDKARFFSYRRDGENSGRMLAAIAVRSALVPFTRAPRV